MLLLVTCNMPMYTTCNIVCTCMFFSNNKITTTKKVARILSALYMKLSSFKMHFFTKTLMYTIKHIRLLCQKNIYMSR